MAKKTFNIKSTLSLPPKQLSVDDIESAIKQIHDAKTEPETSAKPTTLKEVSKTTTKKTSATKQPKKESRDVVETPVRKVRLSVDIHPSLHKRLKIKAIEHDSDIMHYVEMLIERDLGE
ncbi:MAG: hypothetical protein GC192_12430 [Bacteroidetes bacterium]|nr:hypothetical protein [Bacteroidota bacterium]